MLVNTEIPSTRQLRLAAIGISLMSLGSLAISIWMMIDFLREQTLVEGLIGELSKEARRSAEGLAWELRLQFRLTILVVLNVIVTAIAMIMLWRAYRESQASLRNVKTFANVVLNSMDLGVVTTDTNGLITSLNKRGMEMLDATPSCIAKPLDTLSSLPLVDFLSEWPNNKVTSLTRLYRFAGQDRSRSISTTCQVLVDYEGNEIGKLFQLRDVTDSVLTEERMRRMERYMGLGTFAAGLQHEIKNPLAALSLHVQLLEEQLDADNSASENKQTLSIIQKEVSRIGQVLEGFRDFAAINSMNFSELDLIPVLRQQVELIRPQAKGAAVDVYLTVSDDEILLEGDKARIEQVILNLIINALESMQQGGTLRIVTHTSKEMVWIHVSDTGCGVSESLRDKIFAPYFSTKVNGTGLGLALCDKIVRQHLGTLEFHSDTSGTTFKVGLPVRRSALNEFQSIQGPVGH